MENLFLLRIEVFVLIFSLAYIIYYFGDKIIRYYLKLKRIVNPRINKDDIKKEQKKEVINDKKLEDYLNHKKDIKKEDKKKLTTKQKEKLSVILKRVQINIEKLSFEVAKSLIIEGLTIDKFNRELNLQLAFLYENEKNYKNSEFIYKDLLKYFKNDLEIRKKLGFNLAVQNKLQKSFNVYEETFKKNRNDLDVIEMLTDLSFNMKNYQKCFKYVNLFLKNKGKNIEKLFIKAECLEQNNKLKEATEIYTKILTLQPYDKKAKNKLEELENDFNK